MLKVQLKNPRTYWILAFLLAQFSLLYALYAQFVQNFQPCPMCWFQRIAMLAAMLVFQMAMLHNPKYWGRKVYGFFALWICGMGLVLAGRHVWMQMHPNELANCSDLGYLMDIKPVADVFTSIFSGHVDCGKIDWSFYGLSMPFCVALVFVALMGLTLLAMWVKPAKFR